jgi:hypothetical protein
MDKADKTKLVLRKNVHSYGDEQRQYYVLRCH